MITPRNSVYTFRDLVSRALVDALDRDPSLAYIADDVIDCYSHRLYAHLEKYFKETFLKEITYGYSKTFLVLTCKPSHNIIFRDYPVSSLMDIFYTRDYSISSKLSQIIEEFLYMTAYNYLDSPGKITIIGTLDVSETVILKVIEKYTKELGETYIFNPLDTLLLDKNTVSTWATYSKKVEDFLNDENSVCHLILKKQLGILNESVLK